MRITYYEETDSAVIVLREPGPDTAGEIVGENLPDPAPAGVVLHCHNRSDLYQIEVYSGASGRLALDSFRFERVPTGAKKGKADVRDGR